MNQTFSTKFSEVWNGGMSEISGPITTLVREHNLKVEGVIEEELVRLISQIILSGDISKYTDTCFCEWDDKDERNIRTEVALTYIPYRKVRELEEENKRLAKILDKVREALGDFWEGDKDE